MIFFSIIIATYNRSTILRSAIDSVLGQTFSEFELIVVDDGSSDSTSELLSEISDSRLHHFHQHNLGVSAARNAGALKASGTYLIFLDADDQMGPNYLQLAFECLIDKPVKLLLASSQFLSAAGHVEKVRSPGSAEKPMHGLTGSFGIDRLFFLSVQGYDPQLRYSENSDLFLRIYKKLSNKDLILCPEAYVIISFEEPASRITRHAENRYFSTVYFMEKHADYFNQNPIEHYNFNRIAAHSALRTGRNTSALFWSWQSVRLRPFLPRAWFSFLKTIGLSLINQFGK